MHARRGDRGDDTDWWSTAAGVLRLFVLPPFLTLVVILFAVAALMDHQARRSRETTCVVGGAERLPCPPTAPPAP